MSLTPREVHVWTTAPGELADRGLLQAYEALLSSEERDRVARLRLAKHRHERLVSRALLRTALSRYAEVSPEAWVFEYGEHGRPELAPGQCGLPLRFNLSHAEDLCVCAVTIDRDVGIDVERLHRRCELVMLAERFFAPSEVRDLHSLDGQDQRRRFFDYWTLKESYIKARGLGMSLPLKRFSFALGQADNGDPIRIAFDARIEDDPEAWQFELFRPTADHVMALGVRRDGDPRLSVRCEAVVPLSRPRPDQTP